MFLTKLLADYKQLQIQFAGFHRLPPIFDNRIARDGILERCSLSTHFLTFNFPGGIPTDGDKNQFKKHVFI